MCRAHATVRELLGALVEESADLTIVDLEAGLENFSRGTPRHVDTLLVVLEPYYKSLETGRRIAELCRELDIRRVFGVANKVRSASDSDALQRFAAAHNLQIAATVPHDDAILDADRVGTSPVDVAPRAPAVQAIAELAAQLV